MVTLVVALALAASPAAAATATPRSTATSTPTPTSASTSAPTPTPTSLSRGGERLVEEVVAVVRNPRGAPPRIVTLTKLTEEARVALVSRGAIGAATGSLDREALRAALEWLLDQMLIADEAARLKIDEVPREDVLEELRRFRARFPSPAEYDRFLAASELPEQELLVTLGRMVRVQRYLESRVGRTARVDDDEVDRWLRERGGTTTAGAVRDVARAQLVEERARSQVKELIGDLRGRADVRILDRLRGPGEG